MALLRRWLYTPIIIWQGDWIPRETTRLKSQPIHFLFSRIPVWCYSLPPLWWGWDWFNAQPGEPRWNDKWWAYWDWIRFIPMIQPVEMKKSCTTWDVKNLVNNGINYQSQLVSRISEPSMVQPVEIGKNPLCVLPSLKLTASLHLKMDGWKTRQGLSANANC